MYFLGSVGALVVRISEVDFEAALMDGFKWNEAWSGGETDNAGREFMLLDNLLGGGGGGFFFWMERSSKDLLK